MSFSEENVVIEEISTKDFIGIYDTNYDTDVLIDWFKYNEACGTSFQRIGFSDQEIPESRSDVAFTPEYFHQKRAAELSPSYSLDPSIAAPAIAAFNDVICSCVQKYANKYNAVKAYWLHHDPPNIQRTRPTEGYHIWHHEDSGGALCSTRKLVTMMYLNDDFEAGETEFLYLSRRETPKKGRVVIWPAGFTHAHRGNPPLTGEKYIATSWIRDVYLKG